MKYADFKVLANSPHYTTHCLDVPSISSVVNDVESQLDNHTRDRVATLEKWLAEWKSFDHILNLSNRIAILENAVRAGSRTIAPPDERLKEIHRQDQKVRMVVRGSTAVTWRGSVTDLVTDLHALLSTDEWKRFAIEVCRSGCPS